MLIEILLILLDANLEVKNASDLIFNTLLVIGSVLVVLIGSILGIKYMTSTAGKKAEAKETIRDYGNKVIFIASAMANRSFSVGQIGNVILLCNAGLPDQKIARGLTPCKGKERCNRRYSEQGATVLKRTFLEKWQAGHRGSTMQKIICSADELRE